jgi:CheY-like chemotaxis protein
MSEQSILVVEDEEIMRDSLVDWFSSEGRTVHAAVDGEQALAEYQLENYDAMIIDLKLPGRDGLDVLAEVRKRNPKARVVIVTAYPSYETAVEAMRRGAIDYLPKPFELEKLEASLHWSYEEIVPPTEKISPPPVEQPILEEENVTPCIWTQAEIVPKRMCTVGYQCDSECDYHAAMMKREKFRDDPRVQPFLDKLAQMQGTQQCRYVMSGDVSARACSSLYRCDECEFSQMLQERIDQQLTIKAENRRRKQAARKAKEDLAARGAKGTGEEPPESVH